MNEQTNVLIALVDEIKRLNDNIEEYNKAASRPIFSGMDFGGNDEIIKYTGIWEEGKIKWNIKD